MMIESALACGGLGFFLFGCWLVHKACTIFTEVFAEEQKSIEREKRICEALLLFNYGAKAEAIELLQGAYEKVEPLDK